MSDAISSKQAARYDASYFNSYRSDDYREFMYRLEYSRIEKFQAGGRVLDVGCGLGGFLQNFPSSYWERYGIDVSELAIQEARSKGILVNDLEKAYDYPHGFFDVILFRGSLQLLPDPFVVIRKCIDLLAPGGLLVFLATPNSNSPYYRLFKTLPFLTPHANFLIPSDIMVSNLLINYGLCLESIVYPYFKTPYSRPLLDHLKYFLGFFGIKSKFAFWRSSMEIYARKPL